MKALIVVDVQYDFCEGGALAVKGGNRIAEKIGDWLRVDRFRNQYDLIIFTQDWHIDPGAHFSDEPDFIDSWPRHCVANTEGAEIHEDAAPEFANYTIQKGHFDAGYSGFSNRMLDDILRNYKITHIDVCGIARDYCVRQTAYDAVYKGYSTRILHDLSVGVHD